MKIKYFIFFIILLLLVGCSKVNNNRENDKPSLLIVSSSYDYKYGATYDDIAIFDDGTVYKNYYSSTKSDFNNYIGSYSINTKNGFTEFVLDKWEKSERVVSGKDISKIKNMIDKLDNQDSSCYNNAKIYSTITVYKEDQRIEYYTSGDCDVTGSNKTISDLLSIVKK